MSNRNTDLTGPTPRQTPSSVPRTDANFIANLGICQIIRRVEISGTYDPASQISNHCAAYQSYP